MENRLKRLFIWEGGRDVHREGTFTGTESLPGRDVYRDGTLTGTGRLPGRDVYRYGTLFIPGLHENVSSTRDDFTGDNLQSEGGMFLH